MGLKFGAVGATAAASLGELIVGVHVSTIYYVDTMLLDKRCHCQIGWPDDFIQRTISNIGCLAAYYPEVKTDNYSFKKKTPHQAVRRFGLLKA